MTQTPSRSQLSILIERFQEGEPCLPHNVCKGRETRSGCICTEAAEVLSALSEKKLTPLELVNEHGFTELGKHIAASEADAARYRWWREHWISDEPKFDRLNEVLRDASTEGEVDAAIDGAIGTNRQEAEGK